MNERRAERRCSSLTYVHLVQPPIANSEVSSLRDEPARVRQLRTSDFYMIGARPAAVFSEISVDAERQSIAFTITVQTIGSDSGLILLDAIISDHSFEFDGIGVRTQLHSRELVIQYMLKGECIRVSILTPDGLLIARGRQVSWLTGLNHARELATYDRIWDIHNSNHRRCAHAEPFGHAVSTP